MLKTSIAHILRHIITYFFLTKHKDSNLRQKQYTLHIIAFYQSSRTSTQSCTSAKCGTLKRCLDAGAACLASNTAAAATSDQLSACFRNLGKICPVYTQSTIYFDPSPMTWRLKPRSEYCHLAPADSSLINSSLNMLS